MPEIVSIKRKFKVYKEDFFASGELKHGTEVIIDYSDKPKLNDGEILGRVHLVALIKMDSYEEYPRFLKFKGESFRVFDLHPIDEPKGFASASLCPYIDKADMIEPEEYHKETLRLIQEWGDESIRKIYE